MRTHPFGADGPALRVVGQGTWYLDEARRADAVAALRAGLDHGLAHIDTAEMYGDGRVEAIVGEAIADLARDTLYIVSKVLPHNASAAGTIAACEASLRRLGTDYLDAYLLHWRGALPLAETFEAFERLVEAGKIRRYGVSNFDVEDMIEAHALVGDGKICCNQVLYYLEERHIEGGLSGWCRDHGVAVVGYSPFGSGNFTAPRSPGGRVLAEIAAAHDATTRQVALAFLARDAFVIPKSARASHVRENAAAAALALTDADRQAIDAAFPLRPRHGLPMI